MKLLTMILFGASSAVYAGQFQFQAQYSEKSKTQIQDNQYDISSYYSSASHNNDLYHRSKGLMLRLENEKLLTQKSTHQLVLEEVQNARNSKLFQNIDLERNKITEAQLNSYIKYHIIINSAIESRSIDHLNQVLATGKKELELRYKLRMLRYLGSRSGALWTDLEDDHTKNHFQMITSVRENRATGECDHTAAFLTNVGHRLGLKSYSITYHTNKEGHAIPLFQSPDSPDTFYALNYGEFYTSKSQSIDAIDIQSSLPMAGRKVDIFDYQGKPLASVPNALGEVLFEMSGVKLSDLSPEYRTPEFNSVKLNYKTKIITAGVFAAESVSGDQVYGANIIYHPAPAEVFGIGTVEPTLGMAGFYRQGERANYELETQGVFASGNIKFNTHYYNVMEMIRLRAEVGSIMSLSSMKTDVTNTDKNTTSKGESDLESTLTFKAGARSEIDLSQSSIVGMSYHAYFNYMKANLQDENSRSMQLDLQSASLYLIIDDFLNSEYAKNYDLKFDNAFFIRSTGSSYRGDILLVKDEKGVYRSFNVGMTRKVDGDLPYFLPAAKDDIFATVKSSLGKYFSMGVDMRYLEEVDDLKFTFQLEGTYK